VTSEAADRLECHVSPAKSLGLVLLAILMTSAGYFCTTLADPAAVVFGWIGVAFFGLAGLAAIAQLFRKGPQLVFSEDGIEDRRWGVGPIPWAEVVAVWIGSVESSKFLCVQVLDPEPYLQSMPFHRRWLARRNPALGFAPISLAFMGLSPSIEVVWEYLCRQPGVVLEQR
jgi:hypothetical protein